MDEHLIKNIKTLTSQLSGAETEFKSRGEKPEVGLESLPKLNAFTWGFRKGLIVIGSRSSIGKSTIACQFALDFAKQGIDTVFMSLEMDTNSIIERMFCNEMGIDNFLLTCGMFNLKADIQDKWMEFKAKIEKFPLMITCDIGKSFEEVNRFVEILDPKPKVAILDYVQMTRFVKNEREELTEYVRRFRQLMLENNMRGFACSQINRMVEKENDYRPRLENLKSSGALEEAADLALLLHWNYFYTKKEMDKNDYDILVAKNRFGKTGVHHLKYEPEYYRFREREEKNDNAFNNAL